jgi:excisionase family DNA binding protein
MNWDQYTAVDEAELAEMRAQLLNGMADDSTLSTMLGVGSQAINRYINNEGLPYIKLGRRRLFDIAAVNVWLRNRPLQNAPPRGRGRPRKHAAE